MKGGVSMPSTVPSSVIITFIICITLIIITIVGRKK